VYKCTYNLANYFGRWWECEDSSWTDLFCFFFCMQLRVECLVLVFLYWYGLLLLVRPCSLCRLGQWFRCCMGWLCMLGILCDVFVLQTLWLRCRVLWSGVLGFSMFCRMLDCRYRKWFYILQSNGHGFLLCCPWMGIIYLFDLKLWMQLWVQRRRISLTNFVSLSAKATPLLLLYMLLYMEERCISSAFLL